MRSRAERRHHRRRVIRNRKTTAAARDFALELAIEPHKPDGALADTQYRLGCNTPRCGLCRVPSAPRKRDWSDEL